MIKNLGLAFLCIEELEHRYTEALGVLAVVYVIAHLALEEDLSGSVGIENQTMKSIKVDYVLKRLGVGGVVLANYLLLPFDLVEDQAHSNASTAAKCEN